MTNLQSRIGEIQPTGPKISNSVTQKVKSVFIFIHNVVHMETNGVVLTVRMRGTMITQTRITMTGSRSVLPILNGESKI